ncbi:MAG: MerR family transcriptional regulator [Cytophagaceae bacterium]|nr:MerR family transcriptional regulator [Cytophagaceae bacterium]
MNLFSISQLSRFSGIKPHTIRIWEQRYNALKPSRSEGNTRYYDDTQLRRLLNIVSLMESDYKVSELCAMPDEKLFRLLKNLQTNVNNGPCEYFISQLIAAGMAYDEPHFEKIFSHCLLRLGMKDAYIKVLYPMLERVGLMWASDSIPPAQEHFISNIIRQKLFTAIDSLAAAKPAADSWMLFLPENEFHEIGLLLAHYLIRLSGRKVIYLGGNVPLLSLTAAIKQTGCANLLFFLVHYDSPDAPQEYLKRLSATFPGKNIYISGNHKLISQLKRGKKNSVDRICGRFIKTITIIQCLIIYYKYLNKYLWQK